MSFKDSLKGTGVALVTPFDSAQNVDFDALGKLVDYVMHGGVEYLVVLGTTGEAPTLSLEEKKDIIHYIFEKVGTLMPVVVGVGGNSTPGVVKELESLPLEKATAVLSASPYYNRPSQKGIVAHYKLVADASPKPIILYNVPGRTGSNITAETTLQLANSHNNIVGIKEASGNMIQCMHILAQRPTEFLVTSGDDHLALPLIAAGMDGVISVAANCWPKDFSEMIRQSLTQNFSVARGILYKLIEGFDLLFAENNPAGAKAYLSEMGIIGNHLRLPLLPVADDLMRQIKANIAAMNNFTAA